MESNRDASQRSNSRSASALSASPYTAPRRASASVTRSTTRRSYSSHGIRRGPGAGVSLMACSFADDAGASWNLVIHGARLVMLEQHPAQPLRFLPGGVALQTHSG